MTPLLLLIIAAACNTPDDLFQREAASREFATAKGLEYSVCEHPGLLAGFSHCYGQSHSGLIVEFYCGHKSCAQTQENVNKQ